MNTIRQITGYQTSRDYALLWKLAHEQSVVCACDYGKDCRDVAQTLFMDDSDVVQISARGIS